MGFSSYFKAKKPEDKNGPTPAITAGVSAAADKRGTAPQLTADGLDLQVPTPHFGSSRNSVSGRSSSGSSVFVDDIKHEVMVNYLYQQQCSRLWVSDGSGEVEGVLLRKVRGQYLACPPQLADSPFAMACTTLNVPVGTFPLFPNHLKLTSDSVP